MAKLSTEDLLDQFKEMTLIELSEFVKAFEDAFDVKAAAPMAMVPSDSRPSRIRLASPSLAFCSWITTGIPRFLAA